jgi:prepilin-type N-terminal cleavage/methylation domain-containing protein
MNPFLTHFPLSRRGGFTLFEMLTVIVIISILAGALFSGISAVSGSNFAAQSSRMSDVLERAREYAVANSTYTWVAFYSVPASGSQPGTVYLATVASADGTSQILTDGTSLGSTSVWSTAATNPSKYEMIDKVAIFPQVGLSSEGTYTLGSVPAVSSPSNLASSTPTFAINLPGIGTENFTQSIEFTPSGEAKVQAAPTQAIEFDLCQLNGAVASSKLVAVVRINGFTGEAQAYQP